MSKVLFVHPDEKVCAAMESVLAHAGHEVFTAQGGASALKMFASHAPDIVVLNHELPRLRPFETFGEIRRIAPEAKVLVFSLLGEAEDRTGPARFGVTALRPGEVLAAIDRLLAPWRGGEGDAPRVLVVDDDAGVRAALSRFLKEKGYDTAEAVDGLAGLEAHEKFRPHLILLDIDMPKLTGVETLKRVRERDSAVGVMMITGNDTLEMMQKCREFGAYDYLLKPFDFKYLEFSVYSKVLSVS